jgi:anthranilate synthase component 1
VLESLSSDEESEMEEVYNKLRALNRALDVAERI